MVFKAYLPDGRIVCSSCKSEVKEKDNRCEVCLSLLDVEKEGMECPYCGKVIDRYATICEYCGKVVKEEKPRENPSLDEEFLLRLLDLGKKVDKESPEDVEERAKALEVIKAVAGVMDKSIETTEKTTEIGEKKAMEGVGEKGQALEMPTEKKEEIRQQSQGIIIEIPPHIKQKSIDILNSQMPELKEKIEALPTDTLKEGLAKFIETLSLILETKLRDSIEKDKLLEEFLRIITENMECISQVIDSYKSLAKMQSALEETISRAAQPQGGKISKKDWLAAQKQVQAELFKVKKELDEETEKRVKKATKKAEEEIERLKARIEELTIENEKLKRTSMNPDDLAELRTMLKILDDLLGELPDERIDEFARSDKFKLYEKILDKYKVGED